MNLKSCIRINASEHLSKNNAINAINCAKTQSLPAPAPAPAPAQPKEQQAEPAPVPKQEGCYPIRRYDMAKVSPQSIDDYYGSWSA